MNDEKRLRQIEVISAVIGSLGIGALTVVFLYMDNSARERQNEIMWTQAQLQMEFKSAIEAKTDTGIISTLLTRVCSDEDMVDVAEDIRKTTGDFKRNDILRLIMKDCLRTSRSDETTTDTESAKINMEIEYNKLYSDFSQQVNIGRQFYRAHLWQAAADAWNKAVIPPYLAKTVIDETKLKRGREALANGQSTMAADLFKEAFRQVK